MTQVHVTPKTYSKSTTYTMAERCIAYCATCCPANARHTETVELGLNAGDCRGVTENARNENSAPSKMQVVKIRDMKMRHHSAWHENARHENAAPYCVA